MGCRRRVSGLLLFPGRDPQILFPAGPVFDRFTLLVPFSQIFSFSLRQGIGVEAFHGLEILEFLVDLTHRWYKAGVDGSYQEYKHWFWQNSTIVIRGYIRAVKLLLNLHRDQP